MDSEVLDPSTMGSELESEPAVEPVSDVELDEDATDKAEAEED